MANVFVSHRSADEVAAERLANDIRAAGHNVWLDTWEIGLGDSITGKMNQGLEGAAYVVLCLSSAGVMSPWMSREWLSTLARQLNGIGVKLLPARLSNSGDPPAILADLKYVDMTLDYKAALAEILRALR